MYSLSFQHCPPAGFISHLADTGKVKISGDKILSFPPVTGGFLKAYSFSDGIQCLVSDYNLKEDFHLHKFPLLDDFFILRIDEVTHADNSVVMVDRKFNSGLNGKKYSFVFLNSMMDFTFIAPKQSHVKSMEILIPRQWLYDKLDVQNPAETLTTYFFFKDRKKLAGFNTPSFIKQFKNIVTQSRHPGHHPFEKEINSLLERFISGLNSRCHELENAKKVKIVNDEIKRLMDVKDYLIQDLKVAPAFSSLQHKAAMSGTTLKSKFKKMYGLPIYEYFQQMRMERARILLLSFKYSVTDVGHQVGYMNLSNFSTAFKKEFGHLPGKFVQMHKTSA